LRDVANFFTGAHVTLNARNEEEVDTQLIIEKVAKSTGSAYSFKERGDQAVEMGPVVSECFYRKHPVPYKSM
jgi:hypothetical protein